ncbi:MAG TPA: CueP family metal-binding protein, partial [Pseudogracilibacillus sp.]|nr:CueP family metal-binding protein [Pseudogracilibacillus sp.]
MRKTIIAIILLMLVLLAACNGKSANEELESKVNEPTDVKELVQNYSVGKITDQSASITSTQLIVTDSNDKELVYDLPEEEFFVSIAPFINETHPCENHSLTGCQGELVNQDFDLY